MSCEITLKEKKTSLALTVGRQLFGQANGYDLGNLAEGPVTEMFVNPEVLAKAVYANYNDRFAKDCGVESDAEFYELLDGAKLREIEEAMREAIKAFFRWGPAAMDQIEEELEKMADRMKRNLQSGQRSGDSPALSE